MLSISGSPSNSIGIAHRHIILLLNIRQNATLYKLYQVRSLALPLQPLSAGNSAEFSQADNLKTIQPREMNLTSLDSLAGSCESIYVYLKP